VSARHLPKEIVGTSAPPVTQPIAAYLGESVPERSLAAVEEAHIRHVLQHCGGNKTQAAEILGISRLTLRNKLKEET